jgi:hypothetical protein
MLFKLLKKILKKLTKYFLKKNKEKQILSQIEISSQSSICSISSCKESFKNISLSEKTRNEISEIILQKLKNRYSKTFQNFRESSDSIIFSFFSEIEMTKQQQLNRSDQNIQKMIQVDIREMMLKIIQQSITATVNVIAATTQSNSSSIADHSQMISKTIPKSRFD